MKNTVYSFRSRLVVLQELDLLFEKTKSFKTCNSHGFLYFFEILHSFSTYQYLQNFSLVSFVPLNKIEQSSFSEHVDPKPFLTFSKALTRRKFQRRLIAPA